MTNDQLRRRIEALEARLRDLEGKLGCGCQCHIPVAVAKQPKTPWRWV